MISPRAKRKHEWKSPHTRKEMIFLSPHRVSPFSRGVISTRARVLLVLLYLRENGDYSYSKSEPENSVRVFLHGGGGPQIGGVTYGGSSHPSCKRDQIKMRDYVDRQVTSSTWGPPPPCKQTLRVVILKSCIIDISRDHLSWSFINPCLFTAKVWHTTYKTTCNIFFSCF